MSELRNEVCDKVKKKFGSIVHFAARAGKPYWRTMRILSGKTGTEEDLLELNHLVNNLEASTLREPISDDEREDVRKAILIDYKTVTVFCEKYPEFDNAYISRIIKGHATQKTKRFKLLINTLNLTNGFQNRSDRRIA